MWVTCRSWPTCRRTSCRVQVDVSRYGVIYGGAQKNIGPAGLTIVIVRRDLLDRALPITPSAFHWKEQAEADSMVNTPPTYAIYVAGLVFDWIASLGGLAAMEARNIAKAALLYDFLDGSGFYTTPARKQDRSRMNVTFHLPDKALDAAFLEGARERGMVQLKGHRLVGGMRASHLQRRAYRRSAGTRRLDAGIPTEKWMISVKAMIVGAALTVAMPLAAMASSMTGKILIDGAVAASDSKSGDVVPVVDQREQRPSEGTSRARSSPTARWSASVKVFGTQAVSGMVTARANPAFTLRPPVAASFAGGKLVLYVKADAQITTAGTIDIAMQVQAMGEPSWTRTGSNSRQVVNQPGPDQVEFDVTVLLPGTLDPALPIEVLPVLDVNSSTAIAGGATAQTAEVRR